MFAGHDTTSILLAWSVYEVFRTPRVLAALRAELDAIFGGDPDPTAIRDKLLSADGEDLIKRMSYASAVIKETLRLHPPAGTSRMAPLGSNLVVKTSQGKEMCLDGLALYNAAYFIQRDPTIFGATADDFMPERWLGDVDTSMEKEEDRVPDQKEKGCPKHGIPPTAWRPFERGPRNCIGQELANIEARVVLAVMIRRYEFVKVGLGEFLMDERGSPSVNEKGQYKVKSELYNVSLSSSPP